MNLSREIYENERILLEELDKKEIISVFWKQLLYFEQNRNSNIEGSQTQFDELFEVDRNFSDFMSWEKRNLIYASIELFKDIQNNTFLLSVDSIVNLHKKFYLVDKNSMNIDSQNYLNQIKPGYILSSNDPINWIGKITNNREEDLKNATLIPVIPEEKKKELEKLVQITREKIKKKNYLF